MFQFSFDGFFSIRFSACCVGAELCESKKMLFIFVVFHEQKGSKNTDEFKNYLFALQIAQVPTVNGIESLIAFLERANAISAGFCLFYLFIVICLFLSPRSCCASKNSH